MESNGGSVKDQDTLKEMNRQTGGDTADGEDIVTKDVSLLFNLKVML